MDATAIALIVESALLAVALVFLVALLRSHAEILRRLVALEAGGAGTVPLPDSGGGEPLTVTDLVGQTPLGDAVKLSLTASAPRTLLAFLSSGCASCRPLWEGLREGAALAPHARILIVTHGPERESPGRLLELAPAGTEIVMSTEAYGAFGIAVTPFFVLVDGDAGRVLGRGSAGSWPQILNLLRDALTDTALAATSTTGGRASRSTSERAARAEAALAAAGITPGHPSLYPLPDDEPVAPREAAGGSNGEVEAAL
jgi:hypothetical protein